MACGAQLRRAVATLALACAACLCFAADPPFQTLQPFTGHLLQHKLGSAEARPLPETMTGGVVLLDYDNDQLLDVFLVGGAGPSHLFRNRGKLAFEDTTQASGLASLKGYTLAASAADFDNDGDTDLFVSTLTGNYLLENREGRFVDVSSQTHLPPAAFTVGAIWFDYSRDGALDLLLVNYVHWDPQKEPFCGDDQKRTYRTYCHPSKYEPRANQLLRGGKNAKGLWQLTDVSAEAGLASHLGKGMAAAVLDFDQDGWLDFFVTNDTVPNTLFRNQGDGTFREEGAAAGISLSDDGRALSSMGTHAADIDGDGKEDLWYTALANETFPYFRNLGKNLFADLTYASKIGRESMRFSGWGCGIFDFDNDGLRDLFAANGDVQDNTELFASRPSRQQNLLLRQPSQGQFKSELVGTAGLHRGAAFGDLDNDGAVDVVVQQLGGAPVLFRNRAATANHWLAVRLQGAKSNRQGLGALVTVELADGTKLVARASVAVGYASSSSPVVHFGLGKATAIKQLVVTWPNGGSNTLAAPLLDRYLTVAETPSR